MLSGVELAKAVLSAKTHATPLLSLGSDDGPIFEDKDGYLNKDDEDVRRCYTRIAARIHPDKLREFADATKAFQALVRAYELCCKPENRMDESDDSRDDDDDDDEEEEEEVVEEEEKPKPKKPTKARVIEDSSDDEVVEVPAPTGSGGGKGSASGKQKMGLAGPGGPKAKSPPKAAKKEKPAKKKKSKKGGGDGGDAESHRTGVRCPRCYSEWGSHLKSEGREALYTSFMRGQRQVHCLSCLFEFGCLTATHHCPHCTREFPYRPQQYCRQRLEPCTNTLACR